jgi:hypothetical protein
METINITLKIVEPTSNFSFISKYHKLGTSSLSVNVHFLSHYIS